MKVVVPPTKGKDKEQTNCNSVCCPYHPYRITFAAKQKKQICSEDLSSPKEEKKEKKGGRRGGVSQIEKIERKKERKEGSGEGWRG